MTEAEGKSPPAREPGAFDFLPASAAWAVFSGMAAVTLGIAAYVYETGYTQAIGFDVNAHISVADRASEWRELWPLAVAIVLGRGLIPYWADLSKYPKWVRTLRASSVVRCIWFLLASLGVFSLVFMLVPGFREVHPESGDDPTGYAVYAALFGLLMFLSSPIVQLKLAPAREIGFYVVMVGGVALFARYLGNEAGDAVINQSGPVTLACLRGDGTSTPIPYQIVRSFGSGFIVRDGAGLFSWIKSEDAKGLEIAPPAAAGSVIDCGR